MESETTVNCRNCSASIKVPAIDHVSVRELLVDFGWQSTKDGALCGNHKLGPAQA